MCSHPEYRLINIVCLESIHTPVPGRASSIVTVVQNSVFLSPWPENAYANFLSIPRNRWPPSCSSDKDRPYQQQFTHRHHRRDTVISLIGNFPNRVSFFFHKLDIILSSSFAITSVSRLIWFNLFSLIQKDMQDFTFKYTAIGSMQTRLIRGFNFPLRHLPGLWVKVNPYFI